MICHFSRPQSCSRFTLRAIEYVVVFCFCFFMLCLRPAILSSPFSSFPVHSTSFSSICFKHIRCGAVNNESNVCMIERVVYLSELTDPYVSLTTWYQFVCWQRCVCGWDHGEISLTGL